MSTHIAYSVYSDIKFISIAGYSECYSKELIAPAILTFVCFNES